MKNITAADETEVWRWSSPDAVAVTGYDPEFEGSDNPLKEVLWMRLDEINEKDRAFLWSYGLMQVEGFFDVIREWGDELSYPGGSD